MQPGIGSHMRSGRQALIAINGNGTHLKLTLIIFISSKFGLERAQPYQPVLFSRKIGNNGLFLRNVKPNERKAKTRFKRWLKVGQAQRNRYPFPELTVEVIAGHFRNDRRVST